MIRPGNRGIRLVPIAVCAAIAVFAVLPALASGDPGGASISGKVTGPGSAPLEEIEVCLEPTNGELFGFCTQTEADGTWEAQSLSPGSYRVEFTTGRSGLNVAPRYYHGAKRFDDANLVTVKAEQTVTGINETLTEEGAAITGIVRSVAGGSPIDDVSACISSAAFRRFFCAQTESKGEYELLGLPAEEVIVEFEKRRDGLETQYYDHRLFPSQATRISLKAGQVKSGIDADMRVGARIGGHIYSPDGLPLPGIGVCAIGSGAAEGLLECAESGPGGAYTVDSLPPAAYKVAFSPSPADGIPGFFVTPSFEEDSWPTQFWNQRRTLAEGEMVQLPASQEVGGIDAHLGHYVDPPAPLAAPALGAAPLPLPVKPALKCKKTQRKVTVKVKGKKVTRCLKKKKKHHRHGKPKSAAR